MDYKLGILVGGGPAPGINAVIGAATIEAINQGLNVVGIFDGFRWLSSPEFDPEKHTLPLDIGSVARIHFSGGSILRTARTSLINADRLKVSTMVEPDPAKVEQTIRNLDALGLTHLITIGGDDTALSARFITEALGGRVRLVHVPKTIDNDLPLPHDVPTFGFSTARYWGTSLIKNLMQDSRTTGRWYLATAMGRSAGWLALGIGQSAGATLTLIPEEFGERTTLQHIADILEGAIIKREAMGRPDGVAVIAEGVAYRLGDRAELERLLGKSVPLDAAGHLRLSEVPLASLLKMELERRFRERGQKHTIVAHELGYELRCADPTPADMGYCRSLGHGGVRMLLGRDEQVVGAMVVLVNGNIVPMNFKDFVDPSTNRMRIRQVNLGSDMYQVARAYMIRLEAKDMENPELLHRLADAAGMSVSEFENYFGPSVSLIPAMQKLP